MPKAAGTSNLPRTFKAGQPIHFAGTLSEVDVHMKPGVRLVGAAGASFASVSGRIEIIPTGDMLTQGNYTVDFDAGSLAGLPVT